MAIEEGPPARALVKQAPSWVVQAFTSTVILLLLLLRQQLFSPFSFLPRSRSKLSFSAEAPTARHRTAPHSWYIYLPTHSYCHHHYVLLYFKFSCPSSLITSFLRKRSFHCFLISGKFHSFDLFHCSSWHDGSILILGLLDCKSENLFSAHLFFRDLRQHHHSCFLVMHWFYYCVAFHSS